VGRLLLRMLIGHGHGLSGGRLVGTFRFGKRRLSVPLLGNLPQDLDEVGVLVPALQGRSIVEVAGILNKSMSHIRQDLDLGWYHREAVREDPINLVG